MTEPLGAATGAATSASSAARGATKSPLAGVARSEAADRLKAELQDYLAAQAQRLLAGAGRKLGETTVKLTDIAEGRSPGFARLALDTGRRMAEGKGPLRSAVETGVTRAKDNVLDSLRNRGGGKGKRKGGAGRKPTVIIEYVDVGVPLRTAYDQWTRYQDFSTFAKGVRSVSRADDTTSDWQLKIFWSSRSWKAHTTEQVPDDRIAWTSEGAKGTTRGVVSFHRLTDSLTRVVLVIEYYPKGLFERTGNLWRAQGRRALLDLKNFVRFITLRGEADEGWRGEIRDGEVVRSHEDTLAEEDGAPPEEPAEEPEEGYAEEEGPYAEEEPEEGEPEEEGVFEEEEEEEEPENENETEYENYEDEYQDVYEGENEAEDEAEDEAEAEYAEGGSRR